MPIDKEGMIFRFLMVGGEVSVDGVEVGVLNGFVRMLKTVMGTFASVCDTLCRFYLRFKHLSFLACLLIPYIFCLNLTNVSLTQKFHIDMNQFPTLAWP